LTQKLPTAATVRVDTGGVMLTRFPDGACAVAVSGQAMHLRAEEARTLAIVLGSLYPSEAA
jgi:hypothetical protein